MITRTFTKYTSKVNLTTALKEAPIKSLGSLRPFTACSFSLLNNQGKRFNLKNNSQSNFVNNILRQYSTIIEPLGPLDGRYQPKVDALSNYFSESAFNRYRIKVEIEWLKFLIKDGIIKLNKDQNKNEIIRDLNAIYESTEKPNSEFNKDVKKIEAVTNHDIKAVEYWIKREIEANGNMDNLIEYVHFTCTSEDINNISYALMLKDSVSDVLIPEFDSVYAQMRDIALRVIIFRFYTFYDYL